MVVLTGVGRLSLEPCRSRVSSRVVGLWSIVGGSRRGVGARAGSVSNARRWVEWEAYGLSALELAGLRKRLRVVG